MARQPARTFTGFSHLIARAMETTRRCSNKNKFYLRQLRTLQKKLAALHIPLVIQVIPDWKEIANFISDFSKKYNIENVYANIEIGVNELKRDKTVQDYLNRHGKELFYSMTVLFFLYVQSVTNHNNHIKYLVHSKSLLYKARHKRFTSMLSGP